MKELIVPFLFSLGIIKSISTEEVYFYSYSLNCNIIITASFDTNAVWADFFGENFNDFRFKFKGVDYIAKSSEFDYDVYNDSVSTTFIDTSEYFFRRFDGKKIPVEDILFVYKELIRLISNGFRERLMNPENPYYEDILGVSSGANETISLLDTDLDSMVREFYSKDRVNNHEELQIFGLESITIYADKVFVPKDNAGKLKKIKLREF